MPFMRLSVDNPNPILDSSRRVNLPYDGSLTPRDLIEKLDVLRVECDKCGRSGCYRVITLAKSIGSTSEAFVFSCVAALTPD